LSSPSSSFLCVISHLLPRDHFSSHPLASSIGCLGLPGQPISRPIGSHKVF
jgi:hypothetical protein